MAWINSRRAMMRKATARLEARVQDLLNQAACLINFLDRADAPTIDMEPDRDGEAEPDEAARQPVTLAPDWVRPVVQHRPTVAEQRAAYRRNGDPIPANLRRGPFGSARA